MADEKVNIKVVVDVKDRDLTQTIAKMGLLKATGLSSGRALEQLSSGASRSISKAALKWKKATDTFDTASKMLGMVLTKFVKLAVKGVVFEMAILSATLIGINALFATGRFLVKAYQQTMGVLAGGAAVAGAALASVASAIREQQAAMFAYRGKGAAEFGSAMNQTRMAMRNLQADVDLASLGIENLNKAYGVMSKTMNVAQINASAKTIKALMDFGSAGQDPAQSMEAVATVVAALSDQKKGVNDVLAAAKKLGPEMQKALKDAKIKTKDQFSELLFSGQLAEKGGVLGQFDAVNNTLINVMKGFFGRIRTMFADVGDQFLEPLKVAFEDIFWSIREGAYKMVAVIESTLGFDGIVGGLASTVDKVTNWMVKMMRQYLPVVIGVFERLSNFWNKFVLNWNQFFDSLRPLENGARSLYKVIRPIWEGIKDGAKNLYLWNDLLVENEATTVEFGERIGDIIRAISDLAMDLKVIFKEVSPFINDLLKGLTDVFKLLSKVLGSGAGKGFGAAIAPLMAFSIFGRGLQSAAGRLIPNTGQSMLPNKTSTMNVNAGTVVVNGPMGPGNAATGTIMGGIPSGRGLSSGAAMGAGGGGGGGGLSSGGVVVGVPGTPGGPSSFEENVLYGKEALNSPLLKNFKKEGRQIAGTGSLAFIAAGARVQRDPARASFQRRRASRRGWYTRRQQLRDLNDMTLQMRLNDALAMRQRREQGVAFGQADQDVFTRDPTLAPYFDSASGTIDTGAVKRDYAARQRQLFVADLKTGIRGAADQAQMGIRGVIGAGKGFMSYLQGPGFDPKTGTLFDPQTALQLNREYFRGNGIQEKDPNDPTKTVTRKYQGSKLMGRLREFRAAQTIKQEQTRFGRGQARFAGSATARMGTSMGLAMASQYAPEEMRGAMALGGTLSQIDPRLGIAAAGVGGALTAQGKMKGALAGAAGGAQIGAMFGPYGALAGAAIGGVFGAVSGAINQGKEQMKQAREAAKQSITAMYNSIAAAAAGGVGGQFDRNREMVESGKRVYGPGIFQGMGAKMNQRRSTVTDFLMRGLEGGKYQSFTTTEQGTTYENTATQSMVRDLFNNQKKLGIEISQSQLDKALENADTAGAFLKELGIAATQDGDARTATEIMAAGGTTKQFKEEQIANRAIDKVNNDRIKALSTITGKSGAEIEVLAQSLGVDLYNPMTKFNDLLGKLGVTVKKTAGQMNDALVDIIMEGTEYFRKRREQREANLAVNTSSRALADKLRSGNLTGAEQTSAVESYAETVFADILAAQGGDAANAFLSIMGSFGAGPEGGAFGKGQVFEGQYNKIAPVLAPAMDQMKTGYAQSRAEQLTGLLFEGNLTGNATQIQQQIAKMSNEQIKAFETDVIKGGKSFAGMSQDEITAYLEQYGLGGIATQMTDTAALDAMADMDQAAKDLGISSDALKNAVTTMNDTLATYFAQEGGMPVRVTNINELTGTDTSTPRGDTTSSRLSQTMARHAQFDGMLTGNRSITSSYRNFALGSINSDHVTGKAYDLTGQNLGQYARLVHANGGFAEFHGTMANRHLHVVPGVGDTAVPSMAPPVISGGGGGSNTTNYYNFEINGANQSPEQIARMVIAKIDERERSMAERS